jgi:hypothetical protein
MVVEDSVDLLIVVAPLFEAIPQEHQLDLQLSSSQRALALCTRVGSTAFFCTKLTFFTDEANFNLSGYVNSQNNICWSSENPQPLIQLPLYNQKIGI